MMKKIMSLLLVIVMAASLFAGCGTNSAKPVETAPAANNPTSADSENTPAETEAPQEPLVLSILYSQNAGEPVQEDWPVLRYFKEYANVEWDIVAVPSSDFETKRQVVFNSGDLPDIIAHTFPKEVDCYSGLLLPISDYFDRLPNFMKFIEDNNLQGYLDKMKLADGNNYYMPVKCFTAPINEHCWIIRQDLLDKNGLEMPTTMDELVAVAKALKEIYPDKVIIGNRFGSANIMSGICWGYDTVAGWSGFGCKYEEETDSWVYQPTTDKWRDMLEVMSDLYASGCLDPEYTTKDSEVMEQEICQGNMLMAYDWVTNCDRMNLAGQTVDPDFQMVPMLPVEGYEGCYTISPCNFNNQAWCFPATLAEEEYFDRFLEFLDWCYTDEAATLLTYGVEGETYMINDAGEKKYLSEGYMADYGLFNNEFNVRIDMDKVFAGVTEELANYYKDCGPMIGEPPYNSPLTPDQIEEFSVMATTLQDHAKAMMESFIQGTVPLNDDTWADFVAECESMGCREYEAAFNESWAAK